MWKEYADGEHAVAMVSTLDRLISAMPENVDVGHVDYVDFGSEGSYTAIHFARAFMKRITLEDEREVRAVLYESPVIEHGRWSIPIRPGDEVGHRVPVDLSTLLMRVVLSPISSDDREQVSSALADAGISVPVIDSELRDRPRY